MKTMIAGAALAALLCGCAANPPPVAAPAPAAAAVPAAAKGSGPAATKASGNPNAVICRQDDAPLASHIPQRNCHTRAEWAEIDKANASDVDQVNRAISSARGQQR